MVVETVSLIIIILDYIDAILMMTDIISMNDYQVSVWHEMYLLTFDSQIITYANIIANFGNSEHTYKYPILNEVQPGEGVLLLNRSNGIPIRQSVIIGLK